MKKLIIVSIVAAFVASVAAAPVASAAPYCGIVWGSLTKTAADTTNSSLTNIRTGRHTCYDRMVFDMNGPASGYHVKYVSNIYADGSGQHIPVRGGAILEVIVRAPAHDDNYKPTYPATDGQKLPKVNLAGYKTFREAKFAGSFEGQTTVGLGVRAKLPFRVLKSGNHVIVDVAHKW